MSLDKFVMRGFTSSTGNSSGSWVGRTEGAQSTTPKSEGSGSTFISVGNGGLVRQFKPQEENAREGQCRDEGLSFDRGEILSRGEGSRRGVHTNRLGSSGQGGVGESATPSSAIVRVCLVLAAVIVTIFLVSQTRSKSVATKWRERRMVDYQGDAE